MADLTCDDLADMMKGDWLEDDLRAARRFLGLCVGWLPQGFLRDTVRQVSEGCSAEEAWQALKDMGGVGDG